jgi:hypothetical protein
MLCLSSQKSLAAAVVVIFHDCEGKTSAAFPGGAHKFISREFRVFSVRRRTPFALASLSSVRT